MLVLGRKKDQEIVIDGGRIVVSVVRIDGDKVRLGITAPRDVAVNRREVQDQLDANGGGPINTLWGEVDGQAVAFSRRRRRHDRGREPEGGV